MSNDWGETMQAAIEDRLAAMSSGDFGALVARVRPPSEIPIRPGDTAAVRASLAAKSQAMWETRGITTG